jgi:hypothetical protein
MRSVADNRAGTGVAPSSQTCQVVKRNLRPCSLFTPDSGHDLFRAVDGLDHNAVRSALERFVLATGFTDKPKTYWRIKFSEDGGALGYWDAAAGFGLSIIAGEEQEFDHLGIAWPRWFTRLKELLAAVAQHERRPA